MAHLGAPFLFCGNRWLRRPFNTTIMRSIWRYLWPLPWTLLGLVIALAARAVGAHWHVRHGVLEVHGSLLAAGCRRLPSPMRFEAITLGHVVLSIDAACLEAVRAHERVHVRQYERWGPLFVPAYLVLSIWQWARGRHAYLDNPFEREAYALAPCGSPAQGVQPAAGNDKVMVE
ncbi:signal peptide prediction [Ottowia testudinis]|uniref:Signal peptide prediction n=1 Tax=Ottowia testudinis TaxID=2816950 RepID=A0A975H6L4_9BURK|nr:signal peptide prediction [Ottowia testudinis]QTD46127.1 signal peptide prediction [Ottowia testudinis]